MHTSSLKQLNKYGTLLSISWQNGFVYRVSLLLWRLRNFLSSVMALTVWQVIFANQGNVFGYTQDEMITYIFLVGLAQSIVLATTLHGLAERVYNGDITYQLLKPINLFGYLGMQDVADKLKNVAFVVIETLLLFLLFVPVLPSVTAPTFLLATVWLLGGAVLNFLINLLFGAIGFYSPDSWGPKFLFFVLLEATAGQLFPLDILPQFIQNILYLTPFPYLSYAQIQLLVGRVSTPEMVWNSVALLGWLIGLGSLTWLVWRRGIRDYEAAGR